MFALTIKNVLANKARVALITLAVVIGVSFVSSTFIFSDSLSNTFTELVDDISTDIDLEVRPVEEFGSAGSLTNETVDVIANIDGVRATMALREADDVTPIASSGELLSTFSVGLSWPDDAAMNIFTITDGAAPATGDFLMSARSASEEGFVLGSTYEIATPTGVVERTLSGVVKIEGGEVLEANVSFTLVPLADAQAIFGGTPDQVDGLSIAIEDTATAASVQAAAQAAIGADLEVVNQRTIEQEQTAELNGQIAMLRNLLLGFAVVSLFVSTFIIYNTFGIILSQRVREIGLLRAIGADAGHIGRSVVGEAVIIGLIASVLGIAAGLGLNFGLIQLLNATGASFPDMETVVALRTVLLAFGIGVGVTVLSALGPAYNASRVAPVTAMRGVSDNAERLGRRVAVGAVLATIGFGAGSFGLFFASGTSTVLTAIGTGIAALFLGITLLAPVLARPIIHTIGTPLFAVGGAGAKLATGNAARNRRRTANTAAALMIGLSLVTTTLVVGQSVKAHVSDTLDNTVSADFVISNDFEPLSDDVAAQVSNLNEIGATVAVSEMDVKIGDEIREADVTTVATLPQLFDVTITTGQTTGDRNAAMLSEPVAAELGLALGDSLDVGFDNGTNATFAVQALFTDTTLLETGIILERTAVHDTFPLSTVDWVAAATASDAKAADAVAALASISAEFPQVDVQTRTEYREQVEAQIDQLLSIVNVMLALSIVIALIGIGLTLALSVFERTREIGLLRAVGMSTRQVRRMVRWEAALIATFGAVLGIASGLLYGWGAVRALPESITDTLSVPTVRIALLVLASGIAGILAALLPARRAARMNVLDAITGR